MQMSGVNGTNEFAGIQSLEAFAPPFTANATVMGAQSYGNAFVVFLVNDTLSQWLLIEGDLISNTCYQSVWMNYTGSGYSLASLGNALYEDPILGVFYTIEISLGTNGDASVALMTNGVTLALQSGLSISNGPFHLVLAQQEGWPCVSGPLVATWQSVSVTPGARPNNPPAAPILVSPADQAPDAPIPPILSVAVSDPNTNRLTVMFYGCVNASNAGPDFTVIALPDTQYYSHYFPWIFTNQTDWIVNNRTNLNIAYVTQLGDCVDDGDGDYGVGPADAVIEWLNATNALYRLESPAPGIPYGVAVGNHDETPNGLDGYTPSTGTTTNYNQYFGANHFSHCNYYGGYYTNGCNCNNFCNLFSASGMDFIVLYFEFDMTMTSTNAPVFAWANNLLQTYSNRRAIVVSHWIINSYTEGSTFSEQGNAIYNALKGNPNLFLMLCGHVSPDGEGQRTDPVNGGAVTTLLSDYQNLDTNNLDSQYGFPRGANGDGWLRIYTFSPARTNIHAQTYSPYLDSLHLDPNRTNATSQFDLSYDMSSVWAPIATNFNIASGSTTSAAWPGLTPGTQYKWRVTVSDGQATTTGPVWTFTVTTNVPPEFQTVTLTDGMVSFEWSAIAGRTYQLQYKTNLAPTGWISLGGGNVATTSAVSATDAIGPDSQRFYRVILSP